MTAPIPQAAPDQSQASVPPAPLQYPTMVNQDWAISMLMEMQKTLGKNEETLNHIGKELTAVKEKTGRMEKVLYASGVVLVICLAVGGWMLNTAKDFVFLAYKNSLEQQNTKAAAPAAPSAPPPKAPSAPKS